jgi:hypothetical protein
MKIEIRTVVNEVPAAGKNLPEKINSHTPASAQID